MSTTVLLRDVVRQARRLPVSKSFHSGATRQGAYDYEHATHMYNLDKMSNRGFKFGAGIFAGVFLGTAIPYVCVLVVPSHVVQGRS